MASVTSCNDYLEQEPPSSLTPENFYTSEDQVQAVANTLREKCEVIVVAGIESLLTTYGDGKINIQSAPYDVLRTLPGVDDILARAILEEREATDENGDPDPFRSADDLFARVDGLDPAIRSRITVNSQYYRITATGRSGDVERRIWCIAYAEGASLRFLRWVEEP